MFKKTYLAIPLLLVILLLPFWLIVDDLVQVTLAQAFILAFVNPIYLIIWNMHKREMNLKLSKTKCVLVILLSGILSYSNWGISSRQLFSPDRMTIVIIFLEVIIGLGIFLFGALITSMFKKSSNMAQ